MNSTEKLDFEGLRRHPAAYAVIKSLIRVNPSTVISYLEDNGSFRFIYAYPNISIDKPVNKIELEIKSFEEYERLIEYGKSYFLKK